jgi:tetratricopeptide (TPR) repeat protein
MPNHVRIFLASSFEEFQDLRRALKNQLNEIKRPLVEAVDLNDNATDPTPALSRCYQEVEDSNLFVLLIGERYGGRPIAQEESYTHLEYKRALKARKTILPFIIGYGHVPKPEVRRLKNDKLEKWLTAIEERHTTAYYDLTLGSDLVASFIVQQVRDRLYVAEDFGDLDEIGEDSEQILEDTLIKRERLSNAPVMSTHELNGKHPLRLLARNHAVEAVRAFDLGLPEVAFEHLNKAVELIPLDVVLGYWLARLLVASALLRNCTKARRIALRCAQVSAAADDERELDTMACLLVAARASESLGDREGALESARKANERVPHHWLSKVEYGRQLALSGEHEAALKQAQQAFWLQPYSILRVQSDAAFTGLGNHFNQFRSKLRQSVTEEVSEMIELEGLIREFGVLQGIQLTGTSDVFRPSVADDRTSMKHLIQAAQRSSKSSLKILQLSATNLSTANDAFTFNSRKGLTPEIKLCIEESIQTQTHKLNALAAKQAEANQQAKEMHDGRVRLAVAAGIGAVLFLAIAIIAFYADSLEIAVLFFIGTPLSLLAAGVWYQSTSSTHSEISTGIARRNREIQQLKTSLRDLDGALQNFVSQQSELLQHTALFCRLVEHFENQGLRRIPFSPAPPIDRKNATGVVRTDHAKATSLDFELDDQLLPIHIRFLAPRTEPRSKYWLVRRLKVGTNETLSRSAAYFGGIAVESIYLYQDGTKSGPFSLEQVRALAMAGQAQATDQAWFEGASDWMPLSSVPGVFAG